MLLEFYHSSNTLAKWLHRKNKRYSKEGPKEDSPSEKTLEGLKTIIIETENRVNNRPLIYINDSSMDIKALTPLHLINRIIIEALLSQDISPVVSDRTVE